MPDRDARKLLDFLVHNRLASLEEKQDEFAAHTLDADDQPVTMAAHDVLTESEAADRLFPPFWAALRHAAIGQSQGQALDLDDADPQQNDMAEALARFLVKSHLASAESEELGPDHYRYRFILDWPGLERVATLAGVSMDAVLAD